MEQQQYYEAIDFDVHKQVIPKAVSGGFWVGITSPNYRCGKTTAASGLAERLGFSIIKFAGPLKEMLAALLLEVGYDQFSAEHMLEHEKDAKPIDGLPVTIRWLQQTLGTEWGRVAVDPNLWVRCAEIKATRTPMVVFDDMRFPNELALLKKYDGLAIRVVRPGKEYEAPENGHASEGSLATLPMVVLVNNGSIEQLKAATAQIVGTAIDERFRSMHTNLTN